MNNGKLNVTNVAQSFDITASTTITLRNTGETSISLGFGDMDSTFAFGEGIMLEVGESFTITSSDAKWGDGTFYAVTKDTSNTSLGYLSYASDGGVAPTLLAVVSPLQGTLDARLDVIPTVTFSNNIDDGVFHNLALYRDGNQLVSGTTELVGNIYTYTPDVELEGNTLYMLVWGVYDFNGKYNSGMSIFTTVAG